jgi:hypothetical protein
LGRRLLKFAGAGKIFDIAAFHRDGPDRRPEVSFKGAGPGELFGLSDYAAAGSDSGNATGCIESTA